MDELEKKNNIKEMVEWILCILIAIVLALLVRHYVFTPTVVNQESMVPTLIENDRLILNRLSMTLKKELKRGDIITFEKPTITDVKMQQYNNENPVAIYSKEPNNLFSKFTYYVLEIGKESYIKRVIGVAGDHILIKDGKVFVNGEKLEESYLKETVQTDERLFNDFTVPDGYVFAMGDNRQKSIDCRNFGCIPLEKVESKVAMRFWPFNKLGKV